MFQQTPDSSSALAFDKQAVMVIKELISLGFSYQQVETALHFSSNTTNDGLIEYIVKQNKLKNPSTSITQSDVSVQNVQMNQKQIPNKIIPHKQKHAKKDYDQMNVNVKEIHEFVNCLASSAESNLQQLDNLNNRVNNMQEDIEYIKTKLFTKKVPSTLSQIDLPNKDVRQIPVQSICIPKKKLIQQISQQQQ